MMTSAIGRLLRLAAVVSVTGLAVGCASSQGPGQLTAPPGYGKDETSRVERLVQYCDRLTEKGELVTALGLCARAHEIDPDNPEPLMKVAVLLQALNRNEAAVHTYGSLLDRHPQHHEARYRLGKLYMETGEPGLAALQFDHATRNKPEDPRPYNALGVLRDQAGEHEAAQDLYRLALERDPRNLSVRNNLGLSLALEGKREEAIEVLAELAVDPEAGQTVLRNLEAAYAARPPANTGNDTEVPIAEPASVEPPAEPAAAAGSAPLDAATVKPAAGKPEAPEAEAPPPLLLRPTDDGMAPQQSGERRHHPEPAGAGASVILAAAEMLMRPPEWADFEPGDLLRESPPPTRTPTPATQDAAPREAAPQGGMGSIILDAMEHGGDSQPDVGGLAILLLDSGSALA